MASKPRAQQEQPAQPETVDVKVVSAEYPFGRHRLSRGAVIRGMSRAAFEESKKRLPPELEEITSEEADAAASVDASTMRAAAENGDAAEVEKRDG